MKPRFDRLLKLAEHFDTLKQENVNLLIWANKTDPTDPEFQGCVGGHAAALFPELKLEKMAEYEGTAWHVRLRYPGGDYTDRDGKHHKLEGYGAIQEFFQLNFNQTMEYFTHFGYTKAAHEKNEPFTLSQVTPQHIASVLREFCQ